MAHCAAVHSKAPPTPFPACPRELAWLWDEFIRFSARRTVGMAVNPLTDLELEAYCRRRLLDLTSWQKDLIFRLDDAARAAWRKNEDAERERQARRRPGRDDEPAQIPVTNPKALKTLFRTVAAKAAAREAAKHAKSAEG